MHPVPDLSHQYLQDAHKIRFQFLSTSIAHLSSIKCEYNRSAGTETKFAEVVQQRECHAAAAPSPYVLCVLTTRLLGGSACMPRISVAACSLVRALFNRLLLTVASTEAARPSNIVLGTHQTKQANAVKLSIDMFSTT